MSRKNLHQGVKTGTMEMKDMCECEPTSIDMTTIMDM